MRLQQGVPLLDRDWNEMEDIRRYFERTLREHYIGDGVPDVAGFAVSAPAIRADDDVVIGAGRCMVDGYDVVEPRRGAVLRAGRPGAAAAVARRPR